MFPFALSDAFFVCNVGIYYCILTAFKFIECFYLTLFTVITCLYTDFFCKSTGIRIILFSYHQLSAPWKFLACEAMQIDLVGMCVADNLLHFKSRYGELSKYF